MNYFQSKIRFSFILLIIVFYCFHSMGSIANTPKEFSLKGNKFLMIFDRQPIPVFKKIQLNWRGASQLRLLKTNSGTIQRDKITAAALAFPLPLGILGVHRLYLGTKPSVPVFYIVTLGGCFGILPFIDFVVLLLAEDIERFENNPRLFMWNND